MCWPHSSSRTRLGKCPPGGWRTALVHGGCWWPTSGCGRSARACGLAEAGAYPSSGLLISRWFPFHQRARANSVVAFGGRVGNSMALWLTAVAIAALGSWRPVLWTYGAIGLALALATHVVFRDSPREHPWANEAERQLTAPVKAAHFRSPWRELIRHSGLWFFNAGSVGLNIGWAFLITWLPAYLQDVHKLDRLTDREPLCVHRARVQPGRDALRRLVVRPAHPAVRAAGDDGCRS